MRKERRSSMDRVLDILMMFGETSGELPLQSLAKNAGRSRSSLYRYLQVLRERGLVEESNLPGHYRLGPAVVALTRNLNDRRGMIAQAEAIMRALSRETGESILLTQRAGARVFVVASVESPQIVCVNLVKAQNLPLHVSSIGKLHLAFLPPAEIERVLNRPLRSYTPQTTIDPFALTSELKQIRERGYATSEGELEIGAKSISAPICLPAGNVTATLTLAGPAFRLTTPIVRKLIPRIVAAAQRITKHWNAGPAGGARGDSFYGSFRMQRRRGYPLREGSNYGLRNLPAQSPLFPAEAEHYARRAIELSREAAARCDVIFEVPYGEDDSQKMDIYRPPGAAQSRLPVLIFAHGGGWTHGFKEWMGLLAPPITAIPAIFVSVGYRLAPEHRFPAQVDDCVAALRWVSDQIERFDGDPSRIAVGGHSAGGHLYALATVRHDLLRAAGLQPSIIKGCFPVSARFNLVFANPEPDTTEYRINSLLLASPKDGGAASPLCYVKSNCVPFYLTYGTRDFPNIIKSNEEMFAALREQGTRVERLILTNYDHFDTALETRDIDHPWPAMVRKALLESHK